MSTSQELRLFSTIFIAAAIISLDWPMLAFSVAIICNIGAIFIDHKSNP